MCQGQCKKYLNRLLIHETDELHIVFLAKAYLRPLDHSRRWRGGGGLGAVPVWVFMCSSKYCFMLKSLPHHWHMNCLCPMWMLIWERSWYLYWNRSLQFCNAHTLPHIYHGQDGAQHIHTHWALHLPPSLTAPRTRHQHQTPPASLASHSQSPRSLTLSPLQRAMEKL